MNVTSNENLVGVVGQALRKILVFRGRSEDARSPISATTNPVMDLGIPSDDLILVGPELSMVSPELDLPNEVFDWADDSRGTRRYRTVGEMAERISKHIAAAPGVHAHG